MGGTEQPDFLSREGEKQDAALGPRLGGGPAGDFEQPGGAGGIVVGAMVNGLARLVRGHGALFPHPDVVVMGADNHVFISFAGPVGGHVGDAAGLAADIGGQLDRHPAGKGEAARLQVLVHLSDPFLQGCAGGLQPAVRDVRLHLHHWDGSESGPSQPGEFIHFVRISVIGDVVHQQEGLCPVKACVDGLDLGLRVTRVDLPGEDALLVEFLRFVPDHQHDFVLDVEAGVIVVVVLGRGDAVTGKHHRTSHLAVR